MPKKAISLLTALSLLAVIPLLGCPVRNAQRSVDVDFLWVKTAGGHPTAEGGTTRARIVLSPNPGGDIRVGVLEESPGSIGEMWRAAVWLSAVMSALATGQDLGSKKITVEANGFIDGPSAGALMTAAMMAARLGDKLRPDVTITGTVNPDGSIGPVGGIPIKMTAAIREGKKVIGYPIGQGLARDHVTGRIVNLPDLARRKGAEAVEVADIHAAYALLTGHKLDRPKALPIRGMALPVQLRGGLEARAKAWLARAQASYRSVHIPPIPALRQRWQSTLRSIQETQRYLSRGDVAAAYWHAARTAIDADTNAALTRFAVLAPQQDIRAAMGTLQRLIPNVDQRFRALTARIRRHDVTAVDETLRELDALEAVVASAVFLKQAAAGYQTVVQRVRMMLAQPGGRTPERVAALTAELVGPVRTLIIANANIQIAADTMDLPVEAKRSVDAGEKKRDQLTALFTRAAQANLHYFDAIYIDQLAKSRHVPAEAAMQSFMRSDRSYLSAKAHLAVNDIATLGADTPAQKLAHLAGALSSFFHSAALIARYDSLQIQRDPRTGVTLAIGRERIFWRMLALAERKAREHAAEAKRAIGRVPTSALIAYHIGRVYQERPGLDDKLNALEQFWRASVWSQLATLLANNN